MVHGVVVELSSFDFDYNDGLPHFMEAGGGLDRSKVLAPSTRKSNKDIIFFFVISSCNPWHLYNSHTLTNERSISW